MKRGEVTIENAMEILSDELRRELGAEARQYAEDGREPRLDFGGATTFWDAVVREHRALFWLDAYSKRKARIERQRSTTTRTTKDSHG